jgi:hypothetical protein
LPNIDIPNRLPPNVAIAIADRGALCDRYAETVPTAPLGLTPHFEARVKKLGRVSMNCQPSALVGFLRDGNYKNLHELIAEHHITPGADYGVRLAVETALGYAGHHRNLIYGSLNIGNAGCRFYGPYCVVLKPDSVAERVVFLEQNSMGYFGLRFVGDQFDGKLEEGVWAREADVYMLAVCKLVERLKAMRGYDVPAMCDAVAGYFDSIEAHIYGEVLAEHIEEIRVAPELLVQFLYLKSRKKRSVDEAVWYRTHAKVLAAIERKNIRLRVATGDPAPSTLP